LDDLEDDSVLRSIYAKLMGKNLADMTSDNSTSFDRHPINTFRGVSRPTSGVSFAGLESFEEVRRGFEFSGDRSFYPPPARNSRAPHRREDSAFSIASVSSYGRVLNNGVSDPFDYGLPRLRERPSSEDISSISMSLTVDDTFAFIRGQPRTRVDSDASSFYFHDPARGHKRRVQHVGLISSTPD
jgi:serine/arginine repetitive matrix protein 2